MVETVYHFYLVHFPVFTGTFKILTAFIKSKQISDCVMTQSQSLQAKQPTQSVIPPVPCPPPALKSTRTWKVFHQKTRWNSLNLSLWLYFQCAFGRKKRKKKPANLCQKLSNFVCLSIRKASILVSVNIWT